MCGLSARFVGEETHSVTQRVPNQNQHLPAQWI